MIVSGREAAVEERPREERVVDELAALSAHLNAATARWLELAWTLCSGGDVDDPARFIAFRCGVTPREARDALRVAEALQELPAVRAAFSRGELTYTKVRSLTRVATPSSEESLLGLAAVLTASQLERALRAFTRLTAAEAGRTHELEYVSYHFEEDGSLYLRARLPAEEGTLLVKALDAARERIYGRRRAEQADVAGRMTGGDDAVLAREPERPASVEALVEIAEVSLAAVGDESDGERARLVVHVDAAALTTDGRGRSELEDGPVIAPETARRLGCDADVVTRIEHDGLPLSVGRARRSVPPGLRRVLEARDDHTCRFPGCDRRRRLHAHHRRHWAYGGDTSLDNLVLLCPHHHRLVHEGGYTIEDSGADGLRFRNRHGLVTTNLPTRPPPGSTRRLLDENHARGLAIGSDTNRHGHGDPLDLGLAVDAIIAAAA